MNFSEAKHPTPNKQLTTKPSDNGKNSAPNSASPVTASESNNALIPTWFNPNPKLELKQAVSSKKPLYLYIPWIAEHGDTLIARIKSDAYELAPLDIFTQY